MPRIPDENLLNAVYHYIVAYARRQGYPPSHEEIAAACFVSRTHVSRLLDYLQVRGLIERDYGRVRAIRLLPPPDDLGDW